MSNQISSSATAARENARASDGRFGEQEHGRAESVQLDAGAPTPDWGDRKSLEGVPYEDQPKVMADVDLHTWSGMRLVPVREEQADITDWMYDHYEQIAEDHEIPLDGSDTEFFPDYESGQDLEYEIITFAGIHAGGNSADVDVSGALRQYLSACEQRDVIPFSDREGREQRMQDRADTERHATIARAEREFRQVGENPRRRSGLGAKAAAAQAAREVYQDLATEATEDAVDGLKALGRRHGAAFVVVDGRDADYEDDSVLSAFPEFYDHDGNRVESAFDEFHSSEGSDAAQNWFAADKSDAIVERMDLSRSEEAAKALAERNPDVRTESSWGGAPEATVWLC